jgi:hypothetical protein
MPSHLTLSDSLSQSKHKMDGDVKNDTVHHMCGFLPISNDNFPLENESSGWIRNPFSIITPDFSSKDMERCIKLVQ